MGKERKENRKEKYVDINKGDYNIIRNMEGMVSSGGKNEDGGI